MTQIQTGNHALVKTINKSLVLDLIIKQGPVSRAAISKSTGLNRATVSTMVAELIKESFVFEIGEGQSSGGRKPVMLYFNEQAGYSIGIDLGVNYLLGVLTDLSGAVIEEISVSLDERDAAQVTGKLMAMIRGLTARTPDSPYGVIGIGVGVPGIVDREGKILFAPNLGWREVELKKLLEAEFGIPVTVANEANAGANGERLYGAGRLSTDQVYVSIGIGIGTGIVIGGDLYAGTSGIAGEMGHFTIDAFGERCPCGNYGCWELYASENALLKEVEGALGERLELEEILGLAKRGNEVVVGAIQKVGQHIGIGLISIIHSLDPETVIIGNRMTLFEPWIAEPIRDVLEERLAVHHDADGMVRFSELGRDSCAVGAAAFSISGFLVRPGAK
ncbi:ROK family transcriptional regulator [Bhargavaea ginsengi]|uniref:ROK family transcriptional regulator n=1 Tax=Bhargavaea ginsengi TaxID=426757 RepID=UPI00203D39FC|nr:ROK family transcriptional regulator [Bhargavaea ginsengi]MCM3087542.1 ROK family transcriptional regulator [Bhargavaea ginsengi]